MKANDFNQGWTCRHLDGDTAIAVTLPHDAMLSEPRNVSSAGGTNTGWFEGHDYLYEKRFTMDAAEAQQCLVLEFEGVYHNAEVHLNGEQLCYRPYGYTNFYVDLTGKVQPGQENVLQVIARNADQPNSRWYSGAGIYRPVTLWTAPTHHILPNGVRVRTVSLSPAEIEVTVLTSAAGTVRVEIADGNDVVAATDAPTDGKAVLRMSIPGGQPWSPEHPALHQCKAIYEEDSLTVDMGIRTLEWGRQGLLLNGQRVILRGACFHHDNGVLGACSYADAEERKVRLLQKAGYNALRCAHNPCAKSLLAACDRLGMLVLDEYVDMWYIHKNQFDYAGLMEEWWHQDLQDMVEKDYNHPSVIMYSTGNEVAETAQTKGIALTGQMTEYLHSLDDTRPVTCGINIFFNFLSSMGFGVYSDDKARKEAQKAEQRLAAGKNAPKKKAVGSEFFNNLAGLMGADFMKWGASLPPCDWKTKGAYANMDIAGYNYGIRRYEHDLRKYPDRVIVGSETFCSDAYAFWELAQREPRLIGDFVWAGMDYLGEVGVGAWEYEDVASDLSGHGPGWVTAGSGRLDLTGKEHGEAFYTRVAFNLEQGPYIAVCPVNHTNDRHSPSAWRMSNAMTSWSWDGCEGASAKVEVYARAARVQLLLNGRVVGERQPHNDCVVRFTCPYENGTLEAVSYDASGKEIGRSTLQTAGKETRLQLVPEQTQVRGDGLAYVRLQYTDENGTVKPLENGRVQIRVQGGTLLGLGSACSYNADGYLSDTCSTYYGEALAVIQAGKTGPAIEVSASDGTHTATCHIAVQ